MATIEKEVFTDCSDLKSSASADSDDPSTNNIQEMMQVGNL